MEPREREEQDVEAEDLSGVIASLHEALERCHEQLEASHGEHRRLHEQYAQLERGVGPWSEEV